jgi:SAM-dependent methyltransferase
MMTKSEIEQGLARLREQHGSWAYDIPLPYGLWTRGNQGLPHTRLKRIVQAAADLAGTPLAQCRVLDLGCLDGIFSIEFAMQGCSVVGIEIRESNIEKAEFARKAIGLSNVSFVRDDVRNISHAKYGDFDIIVCSGILYHLDAPGVFKVIEQMHDMANRLVVIDTHISLRPTLSVSYKGIEYHGSSYREHSPHESQAEKDKKLFASYDNAESFWLTRPSLVNALANAGFTSVHECFVPAHINFGRPGIESADRCTFVAIKGDRMHLLTSPTVNDLVESWPEGALRYDYGISA